MLLRGRMFSRIRQVDPHVPHLAHPFRYLNRIFSLILSLDIASSEGACTWQSRTPVFGLLYEETSRLISTPVRQARLVVSCDFRM